MRVAAASTSCNVDSVFVGRSAIRSRCAATDRIVNVVAALQAREYTFFVPVERCPTCHGAVDPAERRYRPFCSERCRMLDLSAWTSERYRIAGDPVPTADPANDDDPS